MAGLVDFVLLYLCDAGQSISAVFRDCNSSIPLTSTEQAPVRITEHCVNGIFSVTVGGIEAAANVTA